MKSWHDRHKVVPAVYLLFQDDDKILLLKRANTGYRDGWYTFPSGHFDGGESAAMAAVREAKEEAGVDIFPSELRLIYTQHRVAEEGDHERLNLFFKVEKWQGTPVNAEPHKSDELAWYSLNELPEKLVPELVHFLPHYAKHESYGDFGFEAKS
jgi:8-oxo-dGTP diphosphatase